MSWLSAGSAREQPTRNNLPTSNNMKRSTSTRNSPNDCPTPRQRCHAATRHLSLSLAGRVCLAARLGCLLLPFAATSPQTRQFTRQAHRRITQLATVLGAFPPRLLPNHWVAVVQPSVISVEIPKRLQNVVNTSELKWQAFKTASADYVCSFCFL